MNTITIRFDDATVGRDVTVWHMPRGTSGQGGIVTQHQEGLLVLTCGTAQVERLIWRSDIHHITTDVPYPAEDCLDYNPDTCEGPVDDWWSGGMHGRTWPRCTLHGQQRLDRYMAVQREESMERYADSDVVPDWFDPADAGERWEDDY